MNDSSFRRGWRTWNRETRGIIWRREKFGWRGWIFIIVSTHGMADVPLEKTYFFLIRPGAFFFDGITQGVSGSVGWNTGSLAHIYLDGLKG